MELQILLVFIVLNAHSHYCSTSLNINKRAVKIDETNSFFPEVTYPTSIFDITAPFYYNSPKDDVLAPFSDDVKNSYKAIASKNSNAKISVNELETKPKADKLTDMPKCSIVNDLDNFTENICNILSIENNETLWHNIKSEDTNDFNQDYSVIEPEVHKSLSNQSNLIIFDDANQPLHILEDDYEEVNNLYSEEEHALIRDLIEETELNLGDNFSQYDEINRTDFENILSTLVFDYFDYVQNNDSKSSIIQSQVEDMMFPTLSELAEDLFVFKIAKYSQNINTSNENFEETTVNPNDEIVMDIQKHLGYENKEKSGENDFFLELIISLNHQLQNNDFQIPNNSSDYAVTES